MRTSLPSMLKNEFVHGTVILTIMAFGVNIMNYFFNLVVAHQLGPAVFGDMATMISYLAVFSIPIGVLNLVVIQKIAGKGNQRRMYAQAAEIWLFTELKSKWVYALPLIFAPPFFSHLTHLSIQASYTLLLLLIFSMLGGFYDSVLQGSRQFYVYAISTLTSIGLKLLGALSLIFISDSSLMLLVFLVLALVLKFTICAVYFRTQSSITKRVVIHRNLFELLKKKSVLYPTLSIIGITLLSNVDIMVAKKFFSASDAGIYSSWSLLAKILIYASGSFLSISYIFFSSSDQKKHHTRIFIYSLAGIISIALTGILLYTFASSFVVHFFFGNSFEALTQYLPLAGIFGAAYLLVYYINHYFVSQNSRYSLIVPIFLPFYIAALLFFAHTLKGIMMTNIAFTLTLITVYLALVVFERISLLIPSHTL